MLDNRVQLIDKADIGKFVSSKGRKFYKNKKEYLYIFRKRSYTMKVIVSTLCA